MKRKTGKGMLSRIIQRGGWLNLCIILMAAMLLELVSALQYYYAHRLLEDEMEQRVITELNVKAFSLRQTLNSAEQTLQEHLFEVRQNLNRPDALFEVLGREVEVSDKVVGGFMCFVPDYYPEKGRLFEPYAYEDGNEIVMEQIGGKDGHDYTQHPAFQKMVKERKAFWSDPYEYKSSKGIQSLVTYSYPLLDSHGGLIAVYGLDVSLEWLGDTLNATRDKPSSFDLFLTQAGELVGGPSEKFVSRSRLDHVVTMINDSTAERVPTVSDDVKVLEFYDEQKKDNGYIYYMHMQKSPHWILAMVCYDKEVYGQLDTLRIYITLLMLVGFLLLGFIVHRMFKNLMRLHHADMEKERISRELNIARNIQQSMLPKVFPPFPERKDIDIYGSLLPAREVGGDLFDFFIRDEKLFFCIGDVSGKGVPAALIMAQVHSLFRIATMKESNPARIMQMLNGVLCQNNESNMFITYFIGVLNLPTGLLRYCNAGHDRPVIVGDGMLDATAHLPLGVFDDVKYDMQETTLKSGDMLFLYTDGLTEAMNNEHQQYGIKRMLASLTRKENCETLVAHMHEDVAQFVEGAEQSDDLTMLAVCYHQHEHNDGQSVSITLKNDIRQTRQLSDFIKQELGRLPLDNKQIQKIRLAVEEAVVNVMQYAYPEGQEGDVTVTVKSNDVRLEIIISDAGKPFDPTAKEKADTSLSAEERPIGGLGLLLVRELMDSINYEREGNHNVLTLRKKY